MNYTADFLLGLLAGIDIPEHSDEMTPLISINDGWKVCVFYDCGELDYIEYFVAPDGSIVDFWEWPDSDDQRRLIGWRGA